jgi:hypothetical protein
LDISPGQRGGSEKRPRPPRRRTRRYTAIAHSRGPLAIRPPQHVSRWGLISSAALSSPRQKSPSSSQQQHQRAPPISEFPAHPLAADDASDDNDASVPGKQPSHPSTYAHPPSRRQPPPPQLQSQETACASSLASEHTQTHAPFAPPTQAAPSPLTTTHPAGRLTPPCLAA